MNLLEDESRRTFSTKTRLSVFLCGHYHLLFFSNLFALSQRYYEVIMLEKLVSLRLLGVRSIIVIEFNIRSSLYILNKQFITM